MRLQDIMDVTGITHTGGPATGEKEIAGVYASDLLSDVMGRAKENDLWITLQTHKNIIAVASLKGIAAIVNINGHKPDADTLEAAVQEGIIMLNTQKSMFEICGEIFKLMHRHEMV
jgi:hypothetical protein